MTRRSRRRVVVIVVIAVVFAVVLGETINDVVNSNPAASIRSLRTWEAVTSPIIAEQNALVGTLETFRSDAATQLRLQDDHQLSLLSTATARQRQALEAVVIGPPSAQAGALLTQVVEDRAQAIGELSRGYATATAPDHSVKGAANAFSNVGVLLARSDAAYVALLGALRAEGGRGLFPAHSVWNTRPASWSTIGSRSFAQSLANATQLTARRSIDLVALSVSPAPTRISGLPPTPTTTTTTTVPAGVTGVTGATGATGVVGSTTTTTTIPVPVVRLPQIVPGTVADLPPTSTVTVTAIVRNPGYVPLTSVIFTAVLAPRKARSSVAQTAAVHLGTLSPRGSRFVNVPKFTVSDGSTYELHVTVTADGVTPVDQSFTLRIDVSGVAH